MQILTCAINRSRSQYFQTESSGAQSIHFVKFHQLSSCAFTGMRLQISKIFARTTKINEQSRMAMLYASAVPQNLQNLKVGSQLTPHEEQILKVGDVALEVETIDDALAGGCCCALAALSIKLSRFRLRLDFDLTCT
mmetsp:Transcript_122896/g.191926  ORF Transcript_122896/g.191926 Transcript_122896/m.191926 type:complete len:137 (+) Transcript_122896:94-504(+)